ncbi:hypothetical protein NMG60_11014100 [Bertholletia excelsa]
MERKNLRSEKFKTRHDSANLVFEREAQVCEFSWHQRNYTCNFCKKQFKCAQALGGHMNVHRRERAKLREWDCPKEVTYATPQPNVSSLSSSSARFLPYISYHPTVSSFTSHSSTSQDDERKLKGEDPMKKLKNNGEAVEWKSFVREEECRVLKRKEVILGLDEKMGLVIRRDSKEDLDLELRLGYA